MLLADKLGCIFDALHSIADLKRLHSSTSSTNTFTAKQVVTERPFSDSLIRTDAGPAAKSFIDLPQRAAPPLVQWDCNI